MMMRNKWRVSWPTIREECPNSCSIPRNRPLFASSFFRLFMVTITCVDFQIFGLRVRAIPPHLANSFCFIMRAVHRFQNFKRHCSALIQITRHQNEVQLIRPFVIETGPLCPDGAIMFGKKRPLFNHRVVEPFCNRILNCQSPKRDL